MTTFRIEGDYEFRRPTKVEYVTDVLTDLKRRDFTVNAICLDSKGNIYDPLHGFQDLQNRLIRVIGEPAVKFNDDPLRVMRALRFAIMYDFEIEQSALEYILEHKELIKKISYDRKKRELDKILLSKKAKRGLQYLKELGLLEVLEISFDDNFRTNYDIIGSWSELEFSPNYPFTKLEKKRIALLREIVKKKTVNRETIFEAGLYDSLVAGDILRIEREDILKIYDELPIRNDSELAIDGERIKSILNIPTGPLIKEIKKDLLREVISGNLPNRDKELEEYIKEKWK